MHLIWENLIKNLVLLWTGDFEGLDEGDGEYQLAKAIWEAIASHTSSAADTIPSAYGSRMWSFWTLYLGPVLLRQRFWNQKYYVHFIQLVQLLNICLQFEISDTEIEQVRVGFNDWVRLYEELYFQHDVLCLPICPLTIHALLHVTPSITFTGPVWCYWSFPMERYCGSLQPGIRSRRFPWASMDHYIMEKVQLTQIMAVYNASAEVSLSEPHTEVPDFVLSDDTCVLLPPKSPLRPNANQLKTIAVAISTRSGATMKIVNAALRDALVEEWGKVHHVDSEEGDTMRSFSLGTTAEDGRDSTHVRYEMLVDKYARFKRCTPEYKLQTFYGQLTHIYQVHFSSPCPQLEINEPMTYIFGAIRACSLEADDPQLQKLDIHTYSRYGALDVDITSVQALVGRVPVKENKWAVIDCSGALARAHWADDDGH
ncbi:hypothetical protein C8R43DRAFT_1088094 [Mycena crocata]|nr:hypothetical protein C8R43DRAFT_1088094 [Mycena crocata]